MSGRTLILSRTFWLALFALPATALAVQPADRWALCPPPAGIPAAPQPVEGDSETVRLTADQVESQTETVSRFTGNVVVKRGDTELQADSAIYDKPSDTLQLDGNVSYLTPSLYFQGQNARMQLQGNSGEMNGTRFYFSEFHAFGEARKIDVSDPQHTHLEGVVYSTCVPEHQDWRLKATTLNLDKESNTGEAYNMRLAFKGVPFLYLPYINFPLEGRKSGFLAPTFTTSSVSGNDIRLPFYWNIAPEADATITPRFIAARGNMLMTEGRYLLPNGSGNLAVDYIPRDNLYRDPNTGNPESRLHTSFQNTMSVEGWGVNLIHNYVSDPDFLKDFYTNQLVTSQAALERRADLSYAANHWSFLARAQNFQTLVAGSEQYSRMPQLVFNADTKRQPDTPYLSLQSELVYFTNPNSSLAQGTRLDLTPALSLPLQGAAWFVTPRIALRETQYDLKNTTTSDTRESRSVPIGTFDSGLYFERESSFYGTPMVQTLEPRLYYLYVPYVNQDNLPLFDTGLYDFSYSQLFRDNRFSGADRVGDANQLTTSFTTRYLESATGKERARASIGEITYFADRKVRLPTETDDTTTTRSDIVGEVALQPIDHMEFSTAGLWNTQTRVEDLLTSGVRYRPADDKVASLSYRYQRNIDLRQTDFTFFWPVSPRWRLITRWQYNLETHLTSDAIGGFEYQSCCWAVRILDRARFNPTNQTSQPLEHSIYLTLELKGLSSIGNRLDAETGRGILGFPIH